MFVIKSNYTENLDDIAQHLLSRRKFFLPYREFPQKIMAK